MSIASTVNWGMRADGDDDNGGGWKRDSGTTDYSLQAASQLTVTDGATSGIGVTTLTSATGGFTAAMVGSVVHLYNGTNLTDGWYEITAHTDTNTVTLDRAPDDGVGGVSSADTKVGGALKTPGGLGAILADETNIPCDGQRCYISNAGGTITLTNATVNAAGGGIDFDAYGTTNERGAFLIKGFDDSGGEDKDSFDGDRPIIDCGEITPSNAAIFNLEGYTDNWHVLAFLEIDCNGKATHAVFSGTGYNAVVDVYAHDNITHPLFRGTGGNIVKCKAVSAGGAGFYGWDNYWGCYAESCTYGAQGGGSMINCIAKDCTTAGFYHHYGETCFNCVAYDCPIGFDELWGSGLINCVAYRTTPGGTYAYDNEDAVVPRFNCAHNANFSSGREKTTSVNDLDPITLTADPFTNAANGDFSLNNVAGGGALLRAAGFSPWGQTGYLDVGAVQHEDAGGGGGGNAGLIGG